MSFPKTPIQQEIERATPPRGTIRLAPSAFRELRKGLGPSWAWRNDALDVKHWGHRTILVDDSVDGWTWSDEARQPHRPRAS